MNQEKVSSVGSKADRTAVPGHLEFAVRVAATEHDAIVQVIGELDCYTAPQLRTTLQDVLEGRPRRVVVDVAGSTFIDSTGLSVLVGGLKRVREQGAEMVLRSPTPSTLRVFQIAGVDKLFEIA